MEKNKMNPKKIAVAVTTFASAAFLSMAAVQAATDQEHATKHVAMHHHHHAQAANPVAAGTDLAAGAITTAGFVGASVTSPWSGPGWEGNYWAPSAWGDYDCHSRTFDCRPYSAWGQH